MQHIDDIIQRLGYSASACLVYGRNGFSAVTFSAHTARVLDELSPYAVYTIDNEPFILFFEEPSDLLTQKKLFNKIWNAQIPVAIICGASTVKIYNGCSIDKRESLLKEIEILNIDEISEGSPFSYWEITNQDMWAIRISYFSGEKLNDCLLRNLSDITEKLKIEYNISFATKLTLRLIFIRYLIDRGVDLDYCGFSSDVDSSRTALLSLLEEKDKIYQLFSHLKNKFNGNLFELDNEIEDINLSNDVFALLSDFLSANIDTKTGQLSFFDLYDFNIIPVELISNIYEILLGAEQRKVDNAFYTPQYLVDYILEDTMSAYIRDNKTCTVLDPSCGSGIFLVESYRRMIEALLNGERFTDDDQMLKKTLEKNIYGIDRNPDAIDVAIFSLYLAMLDYKNPRTLKSFTLPNLRGSNLFSCDFFDEIALESVQQIRFDFIVGNPPWGKGDKLMLDYCKKREYQKYLQNKDTCRAFILRSKDFCTKDTQCSFVLHSKMLYMQKQPSKTFRGYLLTETQIASIIELSSVRKLVFKNADAPAVIFSYKFTNTDTVLENRFKYISMKPNIFFKLFNIIVVEKQDVKCVQQKMLKEYDWAWKTLVYGLTGDIDNIVKLKKGTTTLENAIAERSPEILTGTGVQYNDGDLKDASNLFGKPFLDSESIDHFSIDLTFLKKFEKRKIHRPRNAELFRAPYCLVRRGLDMSNYTMRAAYSEESFVFREAFYAIKGTFEQKPFLLNVTGLLNSSAYAYFNLMLDSSLGIEREQRQVAEVLQFPYIFDSEIARLVEKIQKLNTGTDALSPQIDISAEIEDLNKQILSSFDLVEDEFVDYALNIQIPQLTNVNDEDVYRHACPRDFEVYGQYFYNYLSSIFSKTNKHIKTIAYPNIGKHYSAFEVVIQEDLANEWFQATVESDDIKEVLMLLSEHKINDMFYQLKNTLYFSEHSFCIIKPSYYKNWHPAIAKLDLMEVVDQILSGNGGDS